MLKIHIGYCGNHKFNESYDYFNCTNSSIHTDFMLLLFCCCSVLLFVPHCCSYFPMV